MRTFLFGCGIIASILATAGPARAQIIFNQPILINPEAGKLPDLMITSAAPGGQDVLITIKNIGTKQSATSQVRVKMFRSVNGSFQLVSARSANVPGLAVGQSTVVRVPMGTKVERCTITMEVDFLNAVAELKETNNSFSTTVK